MTLTKNATATATMPLDTPVGTLVLECDGDVLVGVWLPNERRHGRRDVDEVPPVFEETAHQLQAYFAGERTAFDLDLAPHGTPFQQRVWSALRAIPYGATLTYTQLAEAAGRPGAARAAGLANGSNPLSIVVPCHRVVGASGRLTGYAGGLGVKSELLSLERARHL